MSTLAILLSAFVLSVVALLVFIWTQRHGLFDPSPAGAQVIFAPGEIGRIEEPSATPGAQASLQATVTAPPIATTHEGSPDAELLQRARADASTGPLVFFFFCCAFAWLLVASAAGLTASIKLHEPDWLNTYAWLTFGRIRTIHLNAVAYGWAPMSGLGIALFIIPRLLKTELVGAKFAFLGAALWNAAESTTSNNGRRPLRLLARSARASGESGLLSLAHRDDRAMVRGSPAASRPSG